MTRLPLAGVLAGVLAWLLLALPGSAGAQTATGTVPSFSLGAEVFPSFTFVTEPRTLNAAGDPVRLNSFDVSRASLTAGGTLTRHVALRIITDVTRESDLTSASFGALTVRLRQAYGEFHPGAGEWAIRIGLQPTPYVAHEENAYRYRFQGPTFTERVGALVPEDFGVSVHAALPGQFGDVEAGIYNGEGGTNVETDSQKAFQVRVTVQPWPGASTHHGVSVTAFYDADHFVAGAPRNRLVMSGHFEQSRLRAGAEYLRDTDQPLPTNVVRTRRGWSIWATPVFHQPDSGGLEVLVRYDHFRPRLAISETDRRVIAGVAYWFPREHHTDAALLVDIDALTFTDVAPSPATANQRQVALDALIRF